MAWSIVKRCYKHFLDVQRISITWNTRYVPVVGSARSLSKAESIIEASLKPEESIPCASNTLVKQVSRTSTKGVPNAAALSSREKVI